MKRISDYTIQRLSKYHRSLEILEKRGINTVSSKELAKIEGITPSQIRKDLSFFGSFGKRGVGYNVIELHRKIHSIMGLDQDWNLALIGIGNLGKALIEYHSFVNINFRIRLLVDSNKKKIGTKIGDLTIHPLEKLKSLVKTEKISIAVVTVPSENAQKVINILSEAGIKAVLNFAPTTVIPPDGVFIRSEDTSIQLEALTYYLNSHNV